MLMLQDHPDLQAHLELQVNPADLVNPANLAALVKSSKMVVEKAHLVHPDLLDNSVDPDQMENHHNLHLDLQVQLAMQDHLAHPVVPEILAHLATMEQKVVLVLATIAHLQELLRVIKPIVKKPV